MSKAEAHAYNLHMLQLTLRPYKFILGRDDSLPDAQQTLHDGCRRTVRLRRHADDGLVIYHPAGIESYARHFRL